MFNIVRSILFMFLLFSFFLVPCPTSTLGKRSDNKPMKILRSSPESAHWESHTWLWPHSAEETYWKYRMELELTSKKVRVMSKTFLSLSPPRQQDWTHVFSETLRSVDLGDVCIPQWAHENCLTTVQTILSEVSFLRTQSPSEEWTWHTFNVCSFSNRFENGGTFTLKFSQVFRYPLNRS